MTRKILKNKPLEIKSEASLTGEAIPEELFEHDIVMRIPPKKKYTIELTVKNIRKGELRFVSPEEF